MSLFCRKKDLGVQSFITTLVNNNCETVEWMRDGPRAEARVRLTIVVLVIPVEDGKPVVQRMFPATTKEFSSTGVSLVINGPDAPDEMILGFHWNGEMQFVRATTKHRDAMGAGFYHLGLQMIEMIKHGECPEVESLSF